MSIFPVLMLAVAAAAVGVADTKAIASRSSDAVLQPIVTPSQARRICADLCMSGLGGEACGENCLDVLPQGLPIQSPSSAFHQDDAQVKNTTSRRDACPMLCSNQLGYPLCRCGQLIPPDYVMPKGSGSKEDIDFLQICGYFCLKYEHRVNGCQDCRVYHNAQAQYGGGGNADFFGFESNAWARGRKNTIDWELWCKQQCLMGQGGAACNCDILPLKAPIDVVNKT